MPVDSSIAVASRVRNFTYAIRNIVAEAQRVEQAGRKVTYLNVGDPIPFGFRTPEPLVEAVRRALTDGCNGYVPSPGIPQAREAVAREWTRLGFPATPDRVLITSGTSEGIELALTALVDSGDSVLVPMPTYPLYTAVLAKIGAQPVYYRTDPSRRWLPDLEHLESMITPRTRALVIIDPNNPTGAVYPEATRRALIEIAERHGLTILADEVYADLAYDGPVPPLGSLAPDAPIISFSSLSKSWLAPGWRAGWLVVGRSARLDELLGAIKKLADGRLCSNGPVQYAIAPALTGDRSFQATLRDDLRARAEVTTRALNAIPALSCVAPSGAFYAMPKATLRPGDSDETFVLELLRRTGILTVYGSGFGLPPGDGFFRVVFLAPPEELTSIYRSIETFARDYYKA
ncbi:MAG TPA: aminotransferase class I/II-fold pyridoxal phosphate-dependent enzyme [Vicinamibacterales bacterium]|nr:aminotransferase class I/II-fold pyridoxal phosphate-dependent enzyme [Vicinamibacterales bacterium]